MGYAIQSGCEISRAMSGGTIQDMIMLSAIPADFGIGSVKTLNYHQNMTAAFLDFVVSTRVNLSANDNYIDALDSPAYIELDDGLPHTTIMAGLIPNFTCFVRALEAGYGEWRIPLSVDLNGYLKPGVEYSAYLRLARSVSDNLMLYHPRVELNTYFEV